MDDDIDLTTLTASELTAYGDQAGWTTSELQRALELRQLHNNLGASKERIEATLQDPIVEAAMNKINQRNTEDQWKQTSATQTSKSWFARLFNL